MIGSPNHVFFIYDGDDSDVVGAGPGPAGSAQIEKVFETYYTDARPAVQGHRLQRALGLRSLHRGGHPGGRPVHRRRRHQDGRGGSALGRHGRASPYDPCYHQACDTYDNVNLDALDVNSDAVAYAVLQYAMNTQAINGERGKGNFKPDYWGPHAIQ